MKVRWNYYIICLILFFSTQMGLSLRFKYTVFEDFATNSLFFIFIFPILAILAFYILRAIIIGCYLKYFKK